MKKRTSCLTNTGRAASMLANGLLGYAGVYFNVRKSDSVMAEVMLKVVSPDTHWGQRLADLLAEHPKVRADRLGFPADWRNRPLWKA